MTSLASGLESLLHQDRMRVLRTCADVACRGGVDLYLVGGAVRDLIMGRLGPDPDLDMAGPRVDRRFAARLAGELGGRFVASSLFGTFKLLVPATGSDRGPAMEIDLVTSRSETYSEPGALPQTRPGTLDQDLARRDFSIGAMCMVMAPPAGSALSWGDLIDPFCGRGDIERGLVRVLHPGSFIDDPTRIFRAVRYATRLGFAIEERTASLMGEALVYVDRLSGDRVRHELERIFDEAEAGRVLELAGRLGVLEAVFPDMGADPGIFSSARFPEGTWGWDEWIGLIACSLPPGRARALAERLNLGSRATRVVVDVEAIKSMDWPAGTAPARPSEVYALLSPRSRASIRACAAVTPDGVHRETMANYLESLADTAPELTGKDLLGMGVPEGPAVGRLLRELLYARLDGEVTSLDEERRLVLSRISRS